MKSEFHSVINEFQRLLNEYNFKCPKKLWYDDLIVSIRRNAPFTL